MSRRFKVKTPPDQDTPLAWEVVAKIIEAEELARAASSAKTVFTLPTHEVEKTEIVDKQDFTIRGDYSLLDETGRGKLRELVVMSPSEDFSILMMSDDKKKLENTYTDLTEIGEELDFVSAFDKNSTYILKINDIPWINNFLFLIHTDTAVTFTRLFAVWTKMEYIK